MGNDANTYLSISIGFLLTYILLNGFDESIANIHSVKWDLMGPIITYMASSTYKYSVMGTMIILIITIIGLLIAGGNKNISLVINIIVTILALFVFIFTTINHNYSIFTDEEKNVKKNVKKNDKIDVMDCTWTQMTLFNRKYSEDQSKDKQGSYDYMNIVDSSIIYKVIYFIGLIILLITTFKDDSTNIKIMFFILAYFCIGLVVQLTASFILRGYSDYMPWPSIFSYLDQYIQNNNDPRRYFFIIVGALRILGIIGVSIFLSYRYFFKGDKKPHVKVFLGIISFWVIFLGYLSFWQVFIGDGCIIDRTLKEYDEDDKKKTDDFDFFKEYNHFTNALVCSVDYQFGIFFHFIIISLSLTIIGIKSK